MSSQGSRPERVADQIRAELATKLNAGTTLSALEASRLAWARFTLADPETSAKRMLLAALAQNRAGTAAAISAATDATIQTAVDNAVNLLAA